MSRKNQNTIIEDRLIKSAVVIQQNPATEREAVYQHSVLCQVFLPLRNPVNQKNWSRKQGRISMSLLAIGSNDFVGLPYGTKARLILSYISTQAIITQSSLIYMELSPTAFTRSLGLSTDGRTIKKVKEQLHRIANCIMRFEYKVGEEHSYLDTRPIREFAFWNKGKESKTSLQTGHLQLDKTFFNSLLKHAVPLDTRAISSLSNNARALDLYVWLAQRLQKVPKSERVFISWKALGEQFAPGYDYRSVRKELRKTLRIVKTQYPNMQIQDIPSGLYLIYSPPPIPRKKKNHV